MGRSAWLAASAALVLVASPALGGKLPFRKAEDPGNFQSAEARFANEWDGRPAVTRVRVPGNFFLASPTQMPVPQAEAAKHVTIDLRADKPTLGDLFSLIEAQGVSVSVDWRSLGDESEDPDKVGTWTIESRYQNIPNEIRSSDGSPNRRSQLGGLTAPGAAQADAGGGSTAGIEVKGAASEVATEKSAGAERGQQKPIAERQAPFRYFSGTVGQLARRLESAGNLAVWWDEGLVVGAYRRYSVAVLQNVDIVQSVVNELKRLGARDVVGSVGAGQVTFSASPRLSSEVIQPYLARVQSNLSEVRLQIALVTVRMTRDAERGFDWSKLNFQFGQAPTTSSNAPADSTGIRGTLRTPTGLFGISADNFEISKQAVSIFGIRRPLSVVGAIGFLSTLGETEILQNAELASLSGAPVQLRYGESIPYATGVQANPVSFGGVTGGTIGSAQTDFLETGLTVNFDPRFDASSGLVTVDIGLKNVELLAFQQVSVGNQIGTLSQPRTSRQAANSIVRILAGQTTIVGGVRRDASTENRNGPVGLFGLGSKTRSREVSWLFAVVRPVVTIYDTSDAPVTTIAGAVDRVVDSEQARVTLPPSVSSPPSSRGVEAVVPATAVDASTTAASMRGPTPAPSAALPSSPEVPKFEFRRAVEGHP